MQYSDDQTGCSPKSSYVPSRDECIQSLMQAMDDCEFLEGHLPIFLTKWNMADKKAGQTDSVTQKIGGIMKKSTPSGCVDYVISAPLSPELPPINPGH